MKILILEDHPLVMEACLGVISERSDIQTFQASSCSQAINHINNNDFDVAIVDLNLPNDESGYQSGKEIAQFMRDKNGEMRLIIITSHTEHLYIYNVYSALQPEGFLIKQDFSLSDFREVFNLICEGGTFLSLSVKKAISEINKHPLFLDNLNRQILILLAQGIKTKSLPDHIPLSLSAIDKRKSFIKDTFNLTENDEDLIMLAKKNGFV